MLLIRRKDQTYLALSVNFLGGKGGSLSLGRLVVNEYERIRPLGISL